MDSGDFDDDGIKDLFIAAPYSGVTNAFGDLFSYGIIYVLYGKPKVSFKRINIYLSNWSPKIGFRLFGAEFDSAGYSISSDVDINADGIVDLIIGGYGATNPSGKRDAGVTYVIYGQRCKRYLDMSLTSLSSNFGFSVFGANSSDSSGYSVKGVKDINGDRINDIVIGAPKAGYMNRSGIREYIGITYVIYGKKGIRNNINLASLSYTDGFRIIGFDYNGEFAWSVSGAGDMNLDGLADIAIGAPGMNNFSGNIYIIYGKKGYRNDIMLSNFSSADGFQIIGSSREGAGRWVSSGDINFDNSTDLFISAPSAKANNHSNAGIVYVIYGPKKQKSDQAILEQDLLIKKSSRPCHNVDTDYIESTDSDPINIETDFFPESEKFSLFSQKKVREVNYGVSQVNDLDLTPNHFNIDNTTKLSASAM